jgi:hypothetical protein
MKQQLTPMTYTLSPLPEMPLSHTTISVAVMTLPIEDQHAEKKSISDSSKEIAHSAN